MLTEWPSSNSDFPWIAGVVANEGLLITGCMYSWDKDINLIFDIYITYEIVIDEKVNVVFENFYLLY